jgi:hypothetical protein
MLQEAGMEIPELPVTTEEATEVLIHLFEN